MDQQPEDPFFDKERQKERFLKNLSNQEWEIFFDKHEPDWAGNHDNDKPGSNDKGRHWGLWRYFGGLRDARIANGILYTGTWPVRMRALYPGELEITVDSSVTDSEITAWKYDNWDFPGGSTDGIRLKISRNGGLSVRRSSDGTLQPLRFHTVDTSKPVKISFIVLKHPRYIEDYKATVIISINDSVLTQFEDRIFYGDLYLQGGMYHLIRFRGLVPRNVAEH